MDTTEEGQVSLHTPDQPSEMGRREPNPQDMGRSEPEWSEAWTVMKKRQSELLDYLRTSLEEERMP